MQRGRKSFRLAIGLAFVMFGVSQAPAQDYRAKVQGVVSDSSQALVVGAKITLRNENTGVVTTRMTGDAGQYIFDFVEPGSYSVTVEMAGFAKYVQEKLVVQVRADLTVNASLQPGAVAETINVTEAAVALQFNTSTMELTVDRKMLSDLPIMQRNPFTLSLLDPAVVNRYWDVAHRNPFYMWSSSQMDVGGNTTMKNDISLDGAPLQIGVKGSYAPPMDAVQEFSVQQNSVDAEFGHSGGGIMSVGMKAGTNDIHGTAYYFGRNPKLNARTNSVTNTRNLVRNHIWGFTVGNPVIKNKLFTFTAYEGWRSQEPNTRISTQPTDLERSGDFSRTLGKTGALRTIFDPASTVLDAGTGVASRTPFAGNIVPSTRIDPTAKRIMQDIWGPNGAGDDATGVNNYKVGYSWPQKYWNFSERVDWNISDKWKAFFRYSRVKTVLDQTEYVKSAAMPNDNGGAMHNRNIAGDTVYTLNPTTVLNVRMSFGSLEDDYVAPRSAIGAEGLAQFWPNNPWYKNYIGEMPAVYYPNVTVGGSTYGKAGYWIQHPRHWTWDASIRKTMGQHSLKAGFAHRKHKADGIFPNLMAFYPYQTYTANTYQSPDLTKYGSDYATFLLGSMDSASYAQTYPYQYFRSNFYGLFFQDDLKLTRNITVNLGMRYEYESGPYDEQDRISRYLDLTSPIPEFQGSGAPVMPSAVTPYLKSAPKYNGAWMFADSSNRGVYKTQKFTFMPRAGVAIRVNDKTAFRAGFARYVIPPVLVQNTLASGVLPMYGYSAVTYLAPSINGVTQAKLSDPFPASFPLTQPLQKTLGRYTNLGDSANYYNQDMKTGVNDRWNATIQRQLWNQLHTDVTFFMNFGHSLPYTLQQNLMDPNLTYTYKAALDATVPNPFYQILTPQKFPGTLRNQKNVSIASLMRPYPQYGGTLARQYVDGALNRYKAVQARVQRAFSKGYSFLVAYNYNQETNSEFFNAIDQYANNLTLIPGTMPRHRISVAGSWDFPFGKGRQYLNNLHPILNGIIGGWQTSHLLLANAGTNLRFGQMITDGSSPKLDNRSPQKMFDTSKFQNYVSYTPRTNPLRYDGVNGPKFWNLDSTLSKTFPIKERFHLEFRFEMYNSPNAFIWNDPNMSVTSSLFGRSTTQVNRGRECQTSLRLMF
jgi:hypothetical protein